MLPFSLTSHCGFIRAVSEKKIAKEMTEKRAAA